MNIEIAAACLSADCDHAHIALNLVAPVRNAIKVAESQRQIWMETHYEKTGHHRFQVMRQEFEDISVARIPDPNQLRLRDDPDHAHLDPSNWNMKEST